MKTPHSFSRNRLFTVLRFAGAGTLISAATAMAFFAGSGRLVSISNPSSQLSQDREAKGKMSRDLDVVIRSARTVPGEGPAGGYEAYKSAARTYPANEIPTWMVRKAKNTFTGSPPKATQETITTGRRTGPCRTLSSPACSRSPVRPIQPQPVVQFSSSRRRACRVTAVSGLAPPAVAFGGRTTPSQRTRAGHTLRPGSRRTPSAR